MLDLRVRMGNKKSNPRINRWFPNNNEQRIILLIGDLLMIVIALLLTLYLWALGDERSYFSWSFIIQKPPFWYFLLPFLWLILTVELYDIRKANDIKETIKTIGIATIINVIVYLVVFFTSAPGTLPRRGIAFYLVFVSLLTFLWRYFYFRIFTMSQLTINALIIGAGYAGQALADVLSEQSPPHINVLGMIDDDPEKVGKKFSHYSVLGTSSELLRIIEEYQISKIIIAITKQINNDMFKVILTAQERGILLKTMPQVYEEILYRVPIKMLEGEWVIRTFIENTSRNLFYLIAKR